MTPAQPPSDAGRGPTAARVEREARILVAEDDTTFRHVLEMLLGEHWTVEAFPDGQKLLDLIDEIAEIFAATKKA